MNSVRCKQVFLRAVAPFVVVGCFVLLQCGASAARFDNEAAAALLVPPSANLTVLVGRADGTAVSGAAVCVASGTEAVRSAATGAGGQVTFNDIPTGQVTITVSSSGFTGQSHTSALPTSGGTARFILSQGSGGPVCIVTAPPPSRIPPTLAITSFDWHVNRRTPLFFEIALSFAATRTPDGPVVPTHYRVGESSDLSATQWIAYQGGVPLFQLGYIQNSLTAYGQRTLFLQLKQGDLASPVISRSVALQRLQTSEFRFDGTNLAQLLDLIQSGGFHLAGRTVSATQSHCSSIQLENLNFDIPNGYLPDRAWEKISEVTLVDSSGKRFTPGWRVKSIEIGDSPQLASDVARTISGQSEGNGFRVVIHLSAGPRNISGDNPCFQNLFPLRAITLEGPADDLALDQTKRWKNMFPQN